MFNSKCMYCHFFYQDFDIQKLYSMIVFILYLLYKWNPLHLKRMYKCRNLTWYFFSNVKKSYEINYSGFVFTVWYMCKQCMNALVMHVCMSHFFGNSLYIVTLWCTNHWFSTFESLDVLHLNYFLKWKHEFEKFWWSK